MNKNSPLSLIERQQIEEGLKNNLSCSKISKILGRGKNTVVAEVRKCGGRENYNAQKAQLFYDKRRKDQYEKIYEKK